MDTPNRSYWHTLVKPFSPFWLTKGSNQCFRAPRSALQNVSNGQSVSLRGLSSPDWQRTPTKWSQGKISASARRINLSIRREISKSHGDLSNLRPKSPPVEILPARVHGLPLSPGDYVNDTQNLFSPNHNRQARQAIPSDWVTGASASRPPTTTEGSPLASQQKYHSPLYGMHASRHIEAEPATISIQGLTSEYIQPLDFCAPVTRSHPGEGQRREALHADSGRTLAVEHINISTAWNGLSHVDANELFRVHQAFVLTLERMLANELWQMYQQLQQQDSAGNISPIHTLFSAGIVRGISFCRDQLVSEMVEALYSSKENTAKAKSEFLRLYLIATDSLVQHHEDGPRDTSITIRMRCDPLSRRPCPVVDAAWVPDSLTFEGLDESPLEGQLFSVLPRYCSKSAFRPTRFPKNVKYSLESESRQSSLSWLVWDDEIAGFKGIVPFYSEVNGYNGHVAKNSRYPCESVSHSLKIIVQAVLVDDNGSSVRYERILRARLTIKVVPWYVNGSSWGTSERISVPKVYQDARLASAAQRFTLQDPMEGSFGLGRSSSGLSQCSKRAHLYMPAKDVHTAQCGSRDIRSAVSSPATEAGLAGPKETDLPSLARTQAYLVAKCAKLTRELERVKEQIMTSSPIGEHHKRMLQAPDHQESLDHTSSASLNHHAGQNEPTRRSSISQELTIPSSPLLQGGDATFQLNSITRFSALPPPAISLRTCPRSDVHINDRSTLDTKRTGWDSTLDLRTTSQKPAPESSTTRITHSFRGSKHLMCLSDQASISSNGTSTSPSLARQRVEAPPTPLLAKRELAALSTSGKPGRKRQARPSLSKIAPWKRSEETGKQPKQETGACSTTGRTTLPFSEAEDQASCTSPQWSGGIFYNSFGPLHSLRSSCTLASEDALHSHAPEGGVSLDCSKNLKHCNQGPGCYMDTKDTDRDNLITKTFPVSSGLEDGVNTERGMRSNSLSPNLNGPIRLCQSSSTSFSPRRISTSSTSSSRSISSDVELIVEQDPHARKVSRREQAKSWNVLSRADRKNGNHPGPEIKEVRLSEDEKKAMDEAMQRSLDDLAEGFDDIFLGDSSESSSGDGDL